MEQKQNQTNNQKVKYDENTENTDLKRWKICEARGKCWQNGNLMESSNKNEIEMMKQDVESDGEEGGETEEPQRQKCRKLEAKVTDENENISNIAITTVHLFNELVRQCKTMKQELEQQQSKY